MMTQATSPYTILSNSATHQGLQRTQNQDYCLSDDELGLYVVADGMGGCPHGERASTEAVRSLHQILAHKEKTLSNLKNAFVETSHYLKGLWAREPHLRGMGTTMSAIWVDGDCAHMAHVGDSRIYLLRGDRLQQLTSDHTLQQELLAKGDASAINYPHIKHVLVRSIGHGDVTVDCQTIMIRQGDKFLLCSDGVHGVIPESILWVNLEEGNPEGFVYAANGMGGPDNITVVLVSVQ